MGAGVISAGVSAVACWLLTGSQRWELLQIRQALDDLASDRTSALRLGTQAANKEVQDQAVNAFYELVGREDLTWEQKGQIMTDFIKKNPRQAMQGVKGVAKEVKGVVKDLGGLLDGWGEQ